MTADSQSRQGDIAQPDRVAFAFSRRVDNAFRNGLVNGVARLAVAYLFAGGVERLAHDARCFVIEIGSGT